MTSVNPAWPVLVSCLTRWTHRVHCHLPSLRPKENIAEATAETQDDPLLQVGTPVFMGVVTCALGQATWGKGILV